VAEVHLRRVTSDNEQECLALRVNDHQARRRDERPIYGPGQSPSDARAARGLWPGRVRTRPSPTLVEVIRCLRLEPDVQMGLTSHRQDNAVVASLFRSLGFVPWDLEGIALKPGEVYLRLSDGR